MKKFLVMMAVVATVMSLVSCSQEKSIYQQETKYLPVLLQGSQKWSILNVETGQLVAKDAFSEAPSPVVDDMFWVFNDNGRIDFYNVADCKNNPEFAKTLKLVFVSFGSRELENRAPGFGDGTDPRQETEELKASGVDAHFYVSPGTAHEWLSWRRALYQFAQLLFK